MDVMDCIDNAAAKVAFAIGEPARAKILYCLMDDHARTSTELAAIADVSASTASAHLDRLLKVKLLKVAAQGRHRYYTLAGPEVARVLEGLSSIAGTLSPKFIPSTPPRLRLARTCYDHIAGSLGVTLHDRMLELDWIAPDETDGPYSIKAEGAKRLAGLGIETTGFEAKRRRVAYGCLDWSERRHHLGGSLGAAILGVAMKRKWLLCERGGRGLDLTLFGRQELHRHFGIGPTALG